MTGTRAREVGIEFPGATGELNGITDVGGVLVGQTTKMSDQISTAANEPIVRTGVTAILPFGYEPLLQQAASGVYSLNGNGEMTGTHWIRDSGHFAGPICITNTHSVGMVHHATTRWMISQYHKDFDQEHIWAMPVVAETYDGVLNDINGQHVTEADVLNALQNASSNSVPEGNTGGGTGMICFEFKGGTGTASRIVHMGNRCFTIGVLVQANHGIRDWLTICGEPIGKQMQDNRLLDQEQGSIIVVIATDLPLRPDQLQRIARRGAIGIGRTGTPGGNNSGDIFLAFSTANSKPIPGRGAMLATAEYTNDDFLDPIYLSVVEAIEESIVNAMLAARDMTTVKPPGLTCKAIDSQKLIAMLRRVGKCR